MWCVRLLTPFPRLMSVSALEGLWRHASSPRLFGGAVASGRGAWDLAREGGNPLVDCFRVCTFESLESSVWDLWT